MRFGAQTVQQNVDWSEILDFWHFLEQETRVESIWAMDHLVPPIEGGLPEVPCFESWSLLAAAAQATRKLCIGCLVTANTFRHPALLAKMAATLDHISAGRLIVSLGAGWHQEEHHAFGIPLYSTRERLERLDEAAALLRAVMEAEKPVSFHGRYYRLENAPFFPGFVQKPHPPLLIGGGGEKRTLRTAARYADIVNILGSVSVVRHKLRVLEAHCEKEGRDYHAIEKTVHVPVVTLEDPKRLALVTDFVKEHFGLSEQQMREETPVGTASHVREVVERYAELDVSAIIFPAPGPWDKEAFRYLDESVIRPFDGGRS
jgi:alkanesulfonate monooxygenase SsuD/methylene tetrahydromethanopterin reductase-like flavin-dependent oxidoreductase (luciferase family)